MPNLKKGPAYIGALLLSGCTQSGSIRDALFLTTRPLDLAVTFLVVLTIALGAWWVILRLSPRKPKRLFLAAMSALTLGLLMASLPTLMLVTGIVWPSLVVVLQLATFGAGVTALTLFATAALLVWVVIAAAIDRL